METTIENDKIKVRIEELEALFRRNLRAVVPMAGIPVINIDPGSITDPIPDPTVLRVTSLFLEILGAVIESIAIRSGSAPALLETLEEWIILNFKQLREKPRSEALRSEATDHRDKTDESSARFAELAAEIHQLRLQVQTNMNTPSSSSTTSTTPTVTSLMLDPPPSENRFFVSYQTKKCIHVFSGNTSFHGTVPPHQTCPSHSGTVLIKKIFGFINNVEQEFRQRNRELQLPTDSTDGWASCAILMLRETAETWAISKWGTNPNVSWEDFKKWLIDSFVTDTAIRDLEHDYANPVRDVTSGKPITDIISIPVLNDKLRELILLMKFVGKDVSEEMAIKHYVEKIAGNKTVALAFSQYVTVERLLERSSKMGLEEVMKYCENVDRNARY